MIYQSNFFHVPIEYFTLDCVVTNMKYDSRATSVAKKDQEVWCQPQYVCVEQYGEVSKAKCGDILIHVP